jgi:DNA polymerase III sliding clamp (beta) subunit (PCNA family)
VINESVGIWNKQVKESQDRQPGTVFYSGGSIYFKCQRVILFRVLTEGRFDDYVAPSDFIPPTR